MTQESLASTYKSLRNSQSLWGFIIVFVGDFVKLEPPRAKETDLLFSREPGGHWEDNLNAVLFLENEHRFKNDTNYRKLLNWMW